MYSYTNLGLSVVIDTDPTKKRYFMSRGIKLSISTRHSVVVSSTTLGPTSVVIDTHATKRRYFISRGVKLSATRIEIRFLIIAKPWTKSL